MISEHHAVCLNRSVQRTSVLLLISVLVACAALGRAQERPSESPPVQAEQEQRPEREAEADARGELAARSQEQGVDDKRITRAVETKLITDPGVAAHLVDVHTEDGVVTLSGTVDHLLAKERAEQVARSIRYVRDVENELEVRVPERDDDVVQDDVLMELASDPATDVSELDVEVTNGIVTLTGEVESWAERTLAEAAAKRVLGVTGVRNGITVAPRAERPDLEIRADILGLLQADARVRTSRMDVQVRDGHVTLAGKVGSALEKTRAIANAWVSGVEAVDASQLEVDPTFRPSDAQQLGLAVPGDERGPAQGAAAAGQVGRARSGEPPGEQLPTDRAGAPLSDEEIRSAVRTAFMYNARVAAFEPEIDVENGIVILSGQVDNLAAKVAAEREARDVVGVRRVRNLLKVRPDEPYSDQQIRQLVQEALERNPYVENNEIRVQVRNGQVRLSGVVDSTLERLEAAAVASRIRGVLDVQNNLLVPPDVTGYTTWPFYVYEFQRENGQVTIKSDAAIKEDIKEELAWSPFVNADSVRVSVRNGVVTLSGTVEDWIARSAAEEDAYEGGARGVINNLTVIGAVEPTPASEQ